MQQHALARPEPKRTQSMTHNSRPRTYQMLTRPRTLCTVSILARIHPRTVRYAPGMVVLIIILLMWGKQLTGIVILRRKNFRTWKVMNCCKVCRKHRKKSWKDLKMSASPLHLTKCHKTLPRRSGRKLRATGTWDTARDPCEHDVAMTSKLVRRRRRIL